MLDVLQEGFTEVNTTESNDWDMCWPQASGSYVAAASVEST